MADKMFSTVAFGGFNKEEVLLYLKDLLVEHENELADVFNQTVQIQMEKDDAKSKMEELQASIEELHRENVALTHINDSNKVQLELANKKIIELEKQLNDAANKLNRQTQESILDIQSVLEPEPKFSRKIVRYNAMQRAINELGEIIVKHDNKNPEKVKVELVEDNNDE